MDAWKLETGTLPEPSSAGPVRRLGPAVAAVARPPATLLSHLQVAAALGPRQSWRRWRGRRVGADLAGSIRERAYERIWREAAGALGATVVNASAGALDIRRGACVTRVRERFTQLDDPVTLRRARDKAAVRRLLAEAGVPVPEHVEFSLADPRPAFRFLASSTHACVVKPAAGTGGGVFTTAGVRTRADLWRAILLCARMSGPIVMERQLTGDVYRLLILDGELLDVIRQRPPCLTGDGRSSIADLIAAENARRLAAEGRAGLSHLYVSLDTILTLRSQGRSPRSVPAEGERVVIQTVTNDHRAEDVVTYRGPLAEELVHAARAAVTAVGLRLGGVDVITPDPGRPLADTGGAVLEVNGAPGLHHHYLVADPAAARPVAVDVLRRLLDSGS